ncbi:MAG TPA: helicase-related protein, partial [Aestuariivirga sp.]
NIRRQRGGAADVMGALSPRTRNAQVALYQSGDVDYLVATDAIGMGLNMDVDHVAFASTRKFDGFQFRQLNAAELGQIAGRAGRYMNDGTFGVSAEADPFEQEVIDQLENHNFDPVRVLQWRNRDLDFRSLDGLRKSLGHLPNKQGLTRAQNAADVIALEAICRDETTLSLITKERDVMRAWEVCQLPDYRNISPAEHAHLVLQLIKFLQSGDGHVSEDWFAKQLKHCESLEGGIDTLSTRISHIRSWSFIAHRADWLEAPYYWQSRTKEIEDKLSDVLHERLTQRFIDRRTSVLLRRLAKKEGLMTNIEAGGEVRVEGEFVGCVEGLIFKADATAAGAEQQALKAASVAAVTTEITARAQGLAATPDTELKLSRLGDVLWHGHAVGRIHVGDHALRPRVEAIADDLLPMHLREEVRERLQKFVQRHLASVLEPLFKLEEAEGFDAETRGMAFRIAEAYGILPREQVASEVKNLSQEARAKLRGFGVRFGAYHLFLPALLKPAATDLRLLLWWLSSHKGEGSIPSAPANGLTSAAADPALPEGFYRIVGYRVCGRRVVRVDMVERLADLIRDRVFWKPRIDTEQRPAGSVEGGGFTIVPDMMSLVGCSGEEFDEILVSLGYNFQSRQMPKPAHLIAAPSAVPVPAPAPIPAPEDVPVEAVAESAPPELTETGFVTPQAPAQLEVPDLIDVKVWWPKDTGPFRAKPERVKPERVKPERVERPKSDKPKFERKPQVAREGKRNGKHGGKPERKIEARPPAPEKPIDPNSPFAKLMVLKEQMKRN